MQVRCALQSDGDYQRAQQFTRTADSGTGVTFSFCPHCGSTIFWELSAYPDVFAIAVGAFADPKFPAPRHSVYESGGMAGWIFPAEHLN
jgi:hypothetical protein